MELPVPQVIVALRGRFRCVAVDYPGFGLSERPAGYGYTAAEHAAIVGKLVDHLGLDGFMVVGQDWGGPIARPMLSRLAREAPSALRGKPMELVWAMKDPAFGREKVIRRWLRDFPDAHVTRLSDANHYVQEDVPEAIVAAVERASVGGARPVRKHD
jgi:pimeloyl-ACP methyl ester carboxylesterase